MQGLSLYKGNPSCSSERESMTKLSVKAYAEVLRLVRRLPAEARPYYSRFARENFATYNDEIDPATIATLLARAYEHSCWVLSKYGVDKAVAVNLKKICKL